MNKEIISTCCQAKSDPDIKICSECGEHCDIEEIEWEYLTDEEIEKINQTDESRCN